MHSVSPFRMIIRAAIAALACASLGLPGNASAGRLNFPLSLSEGGYFVTPISVNGAQELPAVIDTAATIAMIESRAADRAGIAPPLPDELQVPVYGLLGERNFSLVSIDTISSDSTRLSEIVAVYNNREQMPGGPLVIPASTFGGEVLDFDFPARRFSVYDGSPRRITGRSGTGDLQVDGGLFYVNITVNGVKGRALIDTGSPFSFMNSAMARAAKAPQDEEKTQILRGATGGALPVSVALVKRLIVAEFNMRNFNLVVADPAMFEDLGLQDEPAMLLGLDVLSMFRMQIDTRRGEVILTPEDAAPSITTTTGRAKENRNLK